MQSLRNLRIQDVTIASDYHEIVEVLEISIVKPDLWPRYRALLEQISALKDGSYLSLGGPSWLHDRIQGETARDHYDV
ncbi:unnamed protein product [Brassica rapa subsp. trilocularis]